MGALHIRRKPRLLSCSSLGTTSQTKMGHGNKHSTGSGDESVPPNTARSRIKSNLRDVSSQQLQRRGQNNTNSRKAGEASPEVQSKEILTQHRDNPSHDKDDEYPSHYSAAAPIPTSLKRQGGTDGNSIEETASERGERAVVDAGKIEIAHAGAAKEKPPQVRTRRPRRAAKRAKSLLGSSQAEKEINYILSTSSSSPDPPDDSGKRKRKCASPRNQSALASTGTAGGAKEPQPLRRSSRRTKQTLKGRESELTRQADEELRRGGRRRSDSQTRQVNTRRDTRGNRLSDDVGNRSNRRGQERRTRAGPSNLASGRNQRASRQKNNDSPIPASYIIPLRLRRRPSRSRRGDAAASTAQNDEGRQFLIFRDPASATRIKIRRPISDPIAEVDKLVGVGPNYLYEEVRRRNEPTIKLGITADSARPQPLTRLRSEKEEAELTLLRCNTEEWRKRQAQAEAKRQRDSKTALVALPGRFTAKTALDFIKMSLYRVREPRLGLTYNEHLRPVKRKTGKNTGTNDGDLGSGDVANAEQGVNRGGSPRDGDDRHSRSRSKSIPYRSPD